jgi:hypothetical protein
LPFSKAYLFSANKINILFSAIILHNVKDSFLNAAKACLGKSEIHFIKNPVEPFDNSSCQVKPHRQDSVPAMGFANAASCQANGLQ